MINELRSKFQALTTEGKLAFWASVPIIGKAVMDLFRAKNCSSAFWKLVGYLIFASWNIRVIDCLGSGEKCKVMSQITLTMFVVIIAQKMKLIRKWM